MDETTCTKKFFYLNLITKSDFYIFDLVNNINVMNSEILILTITGWYRK